ncbi:MAG: hypothetical protein OEY85_06365, partial [Rhodospirillales bacterium]|nr:hypothetical protein [Rhodospirillales bacterium]
MISKITKTSLLSVAAAAIAVLPLQTAKATTGYFSHGYGVTNKGMAGTGVALSQDTQSAMRNPAAMVGVGDRFDVSLGFFSPIRDLTASAGAVRGADSDEELFLIPDMGANWSIGENGSIGVTMSANGGMNTEYPEYIFAGFTNGAFSKPTGVDL